MMMHFQYLKEFKFEVSKKIQALLVLAKLPSYMNVVTHLINLAVDKNTSITPSSSSTNPTSPISNLTAIEHNKHPPKGKAANKLSTVKQKGKDPKFQQQLLLQQQQQGQGEIRIRRKQASAASA